MFGAIHIEYRLLKGAGTETECSEQSSAEQLLDSWNAGPRICLGQYISNIDYLKVQYVRIGHLLHSYSKQIGGSMQPR